MHSTKKSLASIVTGVLAVVPVLPGSTSHASFPTIESEGRSLQHRAIGGSSVALFDDDALGTSEWDDSVWTQPDSLQIALHSAGIDETIPRKMIEAARAFLSESGIRDSELTIAALRDAEEGVDVVSASFLVPGSVEHAMELDLQVTRRLVHEFAEIPSEFSVAVVSV